MFLIAAAILFGIFGVNVAMGSFANAAFLTGVPEMLLLLAAVVTFVVATLRSEAAHKRGNE